MADLVSDEGFQLKSDKEKIRTQRPRPIKVLGNLEEFRDFGSNKVCWKVQAEFVGNGGIGTFVVYDKALIGAFPDYANSVWGNFANLYGKKVFVVDDIA